jgi:nicotinamide phosphoribosyltransferase
MLLTDSYKHSHWKQYPSDTTGIYSYLESRGGRWKSTVFFGLQYYLKKYLAGNVITYEKIDAAEEIVNAHMGVGIFNREGWEYIVENYGGRLPLLIKAVSEGSVIPTLNVLMTVNNTDPKCYWLTNFIETLLVKVWYGCTVATQSREMKKIIIDNLILTGSPDDLLIKLHDFGYRGVTSVESAGIGGAAHLVNFKGTDNMAALEIAQNYYGEEVAGISIPSSEHSTITSWGQFGEIDAMRNMLNQYPSGFVGCVSDSYDIFKACKTWGGELKNLVMARDGTLIIRPDSGYPPSIICKCLTILEEAFGAVKNKKGYKVLNPHVRLIQGDDIELDMIQSILQQMKYRGWSSDNVLFGSGGGLLQKVNRDTLKFSFKCSAIERKDTWYEVFRNPITDIKKASKRGKLRLEKTGNKYKTIENVENERGTGVDELEVVFLNGQVMQEQKLSDIRQRAEIDESELSEIIS